MARNLKITILGLTLSSSWGNGHATTYRALLKALHARGHSVTFLERDVPWYAGHRDLADPAYCSLHIYRSLDELRCRHRPAVADADLVIVGSYVPDGPEVIRWARAAASGVFAFYDIDTPITLARLERGELEYLTPDLMPCFDVYFSFTGGPLLERLVDRWGVLSARPLPCAVDPELYAPQPAEPVWSLGYLGTYSDDRQPKLERLLFATAERLADKRFVVAGPQYPGSVLWPGNVEHLDHVAPDRHAHFYSRQRWTLNVTRADMVAAGWSPSVRLFEAAACGVPIISDAWSGLDDYFVPGHEIVVAETTEDVIDALSMPESRRRAIAARARAAVLKHHTADKRARQVEEAWRGTASADGRAPVGEAYA